MSLPKLVVSEQEARTRRHRCREAALLRFVMPSETAPEVQYTKTRKRRSKDDDIVNTTLLQLSGGDAWTPALCGYAREIKRRRVELCANVVRNAMLGVY